MMSGLFYISGMALEEKRAWILAVVAAGAYAFYLTLVLPRLLDAPAADVPYAAALLWTAGTAVGTTIALHVAVRMAAPRDDGRRDERDREIGVFGEHVGHSFVVLGAVAALLLALAEADHFWIANALYLAFALSAITESISKIAAYRRGVPRW
ncbi:hypothetical protein Acsp03_27000 [Actinomadura sp. NBRC 104412]|nr:hypothetical protein Acsp03_27000 [Actinomadura sp. NBRC 104412]